MSERQLALTVIVLTKDEAKHIERCLASVAGLAARVVVVDSGSTDATVALARAAGAEVLVNPWINYATQFNWAIDNAAVTTDWTLRLDADEIVLPALRAAIVAFLPAPGDAVGATVNRQMHFMGRWLRWGGIYPVRQLRLWRTGRGRCEDRWMDEHMQVDGPVAHLDADIADINLNTLGWWTEKHNNYATREVADILLGPDSAFASLDRRAGGKRRLKDWSYRYLPPGVRPLRPAAWRPQKPVAPRPLRTPSATRIGATLPSSTRIRRCSARRLVPAPAARTPPRRPAPALVRCPLLRVRCRTAKRRPRL